MTTRTKIEKKLQNAMTVQELIEELESMDPEARVVFSCNYGDHARTQQLIDVSSADEFDPSTEQIYETSYSKTGLAVDEAKYDDEGSDQPTTYDAQYEVAVVILR